jgi:hypothetical protein
MAGMNCCDALQKKLLAEIDAHMHESGISEVTFGKRAAREITVVDRLRQGRVTFRIAKRIEQYLADQRGSEATTP